MKRAGLYQVMAACLIVLCLATVWRNLFKINYEPLDPESIQNQPLAVTAIEYRYGLPVNLFEVVTGTVKPNQMLSKVLNDLGVGYDAINNIVDKTKGIFDVRKFKTGNKYFGFYNREDTLVNLAYLVYENDPANYTVFQFGDSIAVWQGQHRIDTVKQTFAGAIQSSLWNTFADKKANPALSSQLAEIYAWSIDFFGLQVGDSLRVSYDELFIDTISIGINKVHGAWFRHMGKDYWAIPFAQDGIESYYDEEGKSLRKAFLKAPLRFSRISSRFSNSRLHPVLKVRRPHYGIDYAAPVGTPVNAIGDGVVVKAGRDGGAGNMITIKHNSVYSTSYLHLKSFAKGIRAGVRVNQGDVIGYVGSTGLSTGPHLDFRFYKSGHPVDPLRVESPNVDPVKPENMSAYAPYKNEVMESLSAF